MDLNKILIIIILVIVFMTFNINKNSLNSKKKKVEKSNEETKHYFQHNKKIEITRSTFFYVREYKKQLLKNITNLLNDLDIGFVISHGNLIEYERGKPIYHDDDVDIRYNIKDIKKWEKYCSNEKNINNEKYNLVFDKRFTKIKKQLFNGIQVRLINFINKFKVKEYIIDIHLDLVPNFAGKNKISKMWPSYDINFNRLRKIKYLDVDTYCPSIKDTKRVLKKQYGSDYLIPKKKYVPFPKEKKRVITFGTYDLFHNGHINILKRAKNYYKNADLIVGVSTDKLNYGKKNRKPVINETHRLNIIRDIKWVNEYFFEESLEDKLKYCLDYNIDTLIMGDDHKKRFDFLKEYGINVVYLPRTKSVSTTNILKRILKNKY